VTPTPLLQNDQVTGRVSPAPTDLELVGWLGTDQPVQVLDPTVGGDRVAVPLASVERPPSSATLSVPIGW
jgi:hypothetical protein